MSSSSSPHRNSLGTVPVLFLIAMDEQTVSLILPISVQTGCPRIALGAASPRPVAGSWLGTSWSREELFPRDGCVCGGGEGG